MKFSKLASTMTACEGGEVHAGDDLQRRVFADDVLFGSEWRTYASRCGGQDCGPLGSTMIADPARPGERLGAHHTKHLAERLCAFGSIRAFSTDGKAAARPPNIPRFFR